METHSFMPAATVTCALITSCYVPVGASDAPPLQDSIIFAGTPDISRVGVGLLKSTDIRRLACALALLFLTGSATPQVTAMEPRSSPHKVFPATQTTGAHSSDDSDGSAMERNLARQEMQRLNIVGSRDNDRASNFALLVLAPIILLLGLFAFLRGT